MSSPASLIQLQNASKSFGTKTLFEEVTCAINEGEHIGVIGPNGAGKTSLFKIFSGELELDDGVISRSRNLSLGYLKQHDTWDIEQNLEDYLSENTKTPIWDLKKWGQGLNLSEEQFAAPIKAMSGGYRMRAKLLHLLGEQPNLMMLDEPTNYLDLETMLVLEEFLQDYEGAFLLISHDREFLRRTTDHILEVEAGSVTKYNGNIDDYFEQKELLRSQLEKKVMTETAKRKEVLDFAARFGAKASKARQAQSRLKRLEKMETTELKPLLSVSKILIPPPSHVGKIAIEIEDADFGYPDKTVLSRVDLKIESGKHLGVVGYNGAGKSTFLKSIAHELEVLHGKAEWGYQIKAAYYGQHVTERLIAGETVLQSLSRVAHPDVRPQEILGMAGALLFSGDNVYKKVEILSGGEKARVALGQVLLQKAPLLLLDEPTNHLDFYTVEALTQALEKYTGTVIVVSHDRGFIGRIATQILEVRNGHLRLYPGTYDEYVWSVQRRSADAGGEVAPAPRSRASKKPVETEAPAAVSKPQRSAAESHAQKKVWEAERRAADKVVQDLDRKIKILQSRMDEQGAQLSHVAGAEAAQLSRELGASQRKVQDLEAEQMAALETQERLTQLLAELKA